MNGFKTTMLLAALTALFMALGLTLGGPRGMLLAFAIAVAMNLFTYWNADKIVLRMHNARQVDATSAPGLEPGTIVTASAVDGLTVAAGEGRVVIADLQAEGGRALPSRDFLAGHPLQAGARLGAP